LLSFEITSNPGSEKELRKFNALVAPESKSAQCSHAQALVIQFGRLRKGGFFGTHIEWHRYRFRRPADRLTTGPL
jgi:hypothetical protein